MLEVVAEKHLESDKASALHSFHDLRIDFMEIRFSKMCTIRFRIVTRLTPP